MVNLSTSADHLSGWPVRERRYEWKSQLGFVAYWFLDPSPFGPFPATGWSRWNPLAYATELITITRDQGFLIALFCTNGYEPFNQAEVDNFDFWNAVDVVS